jgi:hypothetical protein
MTGKERRWLNPNKGLVKIVERHLDMIVSRFLYPHLSRVWNPYSWLLQKRFVLTETSVSPAGWPPKLGRAPAAITPSFLNKSSTNSGMGKRSRCTSAALHYGRPSDGGRPVEAVRSGAHVACWTVRAAVTC